MIWSCGGLEFQTVTVEYTEIGVVYTKPDSKKSLVEDHELEFILGNNDQSSCFQSRLNSDQKQETVLSAPNCLAPGVWIDAEHVSRMSFTDRVWKATVRYSAGAAEVRFDLERRLWWSDGIIVIILLLSHLDKQARGRRRYVSKVLPRSKSNRISGKWNLCTPVSLIFQSLTLHDSWLYIPQGIAAKLAS